MSVIPLISFGKVIAHLHSAVKDSTTDIGRMPDLVPLTGTVTFSPATPLMRTDDPIPGAVFPLPIPAYVNAAGWLVTEQDETGLTPEDTGIWLPIGIHTVTYALSSVSVVSHQIEVLPTHDDTTPLNLLNSMNVNGLVLTISEYQELAARIDAFEAGSGGGAVSSVNGEIGTVVLDAADVGALPDDYTPDLTNYVVTTDTRLSDARPPTAHSHPTGEVTGLQAALDGKANTTHGHAIADVTGLQTELNGKATTAALTSGLAGKAAVGIIGLPAGSVVRVYWTGSAWPARPTGRTDISIEWVGGTEAAPPTAGIVGVDTWMREVA